MRRAVIAAACAAAVGLAPAARAGKGRQTGRIEGTVEIDGGDPAIGATVTVTGDALVSGAESALTDHRGHFLVLDLPPGRYDVSVDAPGIGRAYAFDVDVDVGRTTRVALRVVPEATETIVIEGTRPPIDTTRSALSDNLDEDFFRNLPVDRRSFDGLLQTLPGAGAGPLGFTTFRGGSWIDNQILIDGINYSDPLTNSIFSRFDFHSLAAVEVMSGGAEADYGEAMGGVVNMVTKSGGNTHELGLRTSFIPEELTAAHPGQEASSQYELNVNARGPIVKNALTYFSSATYEVDFLPLPQIEGVEVADGRLTNTALGFTKFDWQPRKRHKVTLHLSGFWEDRQNDEVEEIALAEAQTRTQSGGVTSGLSYKWFGQRGFVEASTGLYFHDQSSFPMSEDYETPAVVDQDTGIVSGNGNDLLHLRNLRWQVQTSGTRFVDTGWGEHELKAGVELAAMAVVFEQAFPGNEIVYTAGGPCDPEQGVFDGCDFAERTGRQLDDGTLEPGAFAKHIQGLKAGLYARDSWQLGRVRLNGGWRVDLGRIYGGGDRLAAFNGWLGPRLGVIWDVTGRGSTVVRASAGRTYQTGMLGLPLFFGESLRRDAYAFNPATGQFDTYLAQRSTGGDTGGRLDGTAKPPPRSDEVSLSIEQALLPALSARLTGMYRLQSHIYSSVESNLVWNETGSAVIGFRDGMPRARFVLDTDEDYFREYAAVELALRGHVSRTGFVMASYTLSRLYGTSELDEITDTQFVIPYVINNPRQRQFLYGPLESDRRHVVKLGFTYAYPKWNAVFGSIFRYSSGAPYSRLYYNSFLNGYFDRRAPRGIDPGNLNDPTDDRELRGDAIVDWDLFGSWRVPWRGSADDLAIEVAVFNLLNRDAATAVEQRNVPTFGQPLQRQRPLRVSVGLSVRY